MKLFVNPTIILFHKTTPYYKLYYDYHILVRLNNNPEHITCQALFIPFLL